MKSERASGALIRRAYLVVRVALVTGLRPFANDSLGLIIVSLHILESGADFPYATPVRLECRAVGERVKPRVLKQGRHLIASVVRVMQIDVAHLASHLDPYRLKFLHPHPQRLGEQG